MGIRDRLELQQREENEQQQILEVLSDLHGRLDGIETNQREVVSTTNASTQSIIRIWTELEQMRQLMQLMQPLPHSGASVNESFGKTLTTVASTQKEILEVLSGARSVKLAGGSTITDSDQSAHALMRRLTEQMKGLTETDSKLAEEFRRKRTVNINYEKLAAHLIPGISKELRTQERAIRVAWADAAAPVLEELKTSRAAISETGAQINAEAKRIGDQVGKLRRTVTWHTVGQMAAALMPFALATTVVFGLAQTLWAAFGFRPILQTLWAWFLCTPEWYWKLAIGGGTLLVLAAFSWLVVRLGKKLYEWYRGY